MEYGSETLVTIAIHTVRFIHNTVVARIKYVLVHIPAVIDPNAVGLFFILICGCRGGQKINTQAH